MKSTIAWVRSLPDTSHSRIVSSTVWTRAVVWGLSPQETTKPGVTRVPVTLQTTIKIVTTGTCQCVGRYMFGIIQPFLMLHSDIYRGGLQCCGISAVVQRKSDALACFFKHDNHVRSSSIKCLHILLDVCLHVLRLNAIQTISMKNLSILYKLIIVFKYFVNLLISITLLIFHHSSVV